MPDEGEVTTRRKSRSLLNFNPEVDEKHGEIWQLAVVRGLQGTLEGMMDTVVAEKLRAKNAGMRIWTLKQRIHGTPAEEDDSEDEFDQRQRIRETFDAGADVTCVIIDTWAKTQEGREFVSSIAQDGIAVMEEAYTYTEPVTGMQIPIGKQVRSLRSKRRRKSDDGKYAKKRQKYLEGNHGWIAAYCNATPKERRKAEKRKTQSTSMTTVQNTDTTIPQQEPNLVDIRSTISVLESLLSDYRMTLAQASPALVASSSSSSTAASASSSMLEANGR
jgi:hypothetical protein